MCSIVNTLLPYFKNVVFWFCLSSPRTQMSHVCGIQRKRLQPTGLHFLPPVRRCLLHHYRTEWVIAPMIVTSIHEGQKALAWVLPCQHRVFKQWLRPCIQPSSLWVQTKNKPHTHPHTHKERESTDLGKGQMRDDIRTANILYMTQKISWDLGR